MCNVFGRIFTLVQLVHGLVQYYAVMRTIVCAHAKLSFTLASGRAFAFKKRNLAFAHATSTVHVTATFRKDTRINHKSRVNSADNFLQKLCSIKCAHQMCRLCAYCDCVFQYHSQAKNRGHNKLVSSRVGASNSEKCVGSHD